MRWFETTLQDARFASRTLRRNAGFAAIVVSVVALAVGSSTAVFSALRGVLLSRLPFFEPERLVALSELSLAAPGLDRVSFATARDLRRRSRTFEDLALYGDGGGGRLIENGEPEVLRGQRVSPRFFDLLGVRPLMGRTFELQDSLPGANDVILLSHDFWRRRFGGDPAIVGRVLDLNGQPVRVAGVLPASFHPFRMSNPGERPQVFRPLSLELLESDDRKSGVQAIGRLKPGASLEQARAELNTILAGLAREHPADYPRHPVVAVEPLQARLTSAIRGVLWALFAAVALVLLIACANISNLMLVRGAARSSEVAIRTSLGCSRRRLIRQFLTESLLLALIGGLMGTALAWGLVTGLAAFVPAEIPRADEIRVDLSALLFAVLVTGLTGLLAGLPPARRVSRGGSRPSSALTHAMVRRCLVAAEIACAFVLLAGVGLLGRSLRAMTRVDPGYDPHNVLTFTAFAYGFQDERAVLDHYRELVDKVRALPGVEGAGMVSTLPLSQPVQDQVSIEGRPSSHDAESPAVDLYFATPGYFPVMKIPLRRGRNFADSDSLQAPLVALISESAARLLFPGEDPIGHRIRLAGRDGDGNGNWLTIIGITGDVWQHSMAEGPSAGLYLPQSQHPWFYYRLAARTTGDPMGMLPAVRAANREADPLQPLFHVQPLESYVTKSLAGRIFAVSLGVWLASLALLLAMAGIFGVAAFSVRGRLREIGIRMALGSRDSSILWLILRDTGITVAAGLAVGLPVALITGRGLHGLLYRVVPADPVALFWAGAGVVLAACAASIVPAWRALSTDPATVLRHD